MKKIILLVGLAIVLGMAICFVTPYLNKQLTESPAESFARAAKKAEKLCAEIKASNDEIKIIVEATLFLEKKGPARYQEIKNLEAALEKLKEESEKLILESERLLDGICQQNNKTAIEKFRQFGRNTEKVIKIQWSALRIVSDYLSQLEKKNETPT